MNNLNTLEEKHDYGKDVDRLMMERQVARMNLVKSEIGLFELGVKTIKGEQIAHLPNLDKAEYLFHNSQEFSWKAIFSDGTTLQQFQGGKQHHFKHIDQSKLIQLQWISSFITDSSNPEKRVIVTLDWETGKFLFHNGIASQEARTFADTRFDGEAKLIMKMVKRESSIPSMTADLPEFMRYTRYILGWQTSTTKQLICVEPNGRIHIWHE